MEIYYQGTDITSVVHVKKCIVRDTSGKRCDSMEIVFENARRWRVWGPEKDDQIRIRHGGYDSGTMFVNTVLPEDGGYRIVAAALPCRAREKGNQSFRQMSVEDIMHACAAATRMNIRVYGIDGTATVPYIERDSEVCAAFLSRLLALEGAALKCVDGRYAAIGYEYAQGLRPVQTVSLQAENPGTRYMKCGMMHSTLTVRTPFASATAEDTSVRDAEARLVVGNLPALNDIQAGKWARWKLYELNRECERVDFSSDFNPFLTAMVRVDVEGGTEADGRWLVDSAEHNLVDMKTSSTLRRCITTIR